MRKFPFSGINFLLSNFHFQPNERMLYKRKFLVRYKLGAPTKRINTNGWALSAESVSFEQGCVSTQNTKHETQYTFG